jgi:lysophospholipase L1-like esterase
MRHWKINQPILGVLVAALVSTAGAENLTVSARPESCAGPTNSLPSRFTFALPASPRGQVINAMVILPVQCSGAGLQPCLKLMLEKPDGTQQFIADDTISTHEATAHFYVTFFLREHAGATNFPFYVEQVPGPCATVHAVAGRPAIFNIQSAQTPPWKLDDLLAPIWQAHHIINETVLPVSLDGGRPEGRLLFTPVGKVLVRNYALDKTYREGADYVVEGNRIRLPAGSSIPFMTRKQLYPDAADAPPKTMRSWKGGYVAFTEGTFWNDRQIAVTYDHKDDWNGPIPSTAPDQLPRTKAKLRAGLPLKVALLGDSISAGASASKERPPHVPGWGELAMDGLRSRYHSAITFINPSLGGMVSAWGEKVAPFFVAPEKPDLCLIAFGMNDGGSVPVNQYLANTKAIMESVRQQNPETEFILVASWPPNANWRKLAPMDGYLAGLKTLASKHVAVADVWSVASYILKTKRYGDVTGNHVNHPNDFMVRVYAQVTDALLGADKF